MKKTLSLAFITLFTFAFSIQSLVFAQQRPPSSPPAGSSSAGKSASRKPAGPVGVTRRTPRGSSHAISLIEKDFEEAIRVIQEHYVESNRLEYDSVVKSSIIGMLRSLDPHSNYYDREEYEELRSDQRPEYFGIGASIQNYIVGDKLDTFVTATFQQSPAWRAGLRFGDRIVAVDGVKMTGKPSLEVRNKIRGPRGSVVKIAVERAADKRIATVEITRDSVAQPSVPDAYPLKPGVGYIDMTRGFNYTTSDEVQDALDSLHAKGATSLVLDLRNNPGGFLDQAIRVAELFLPHGQLILTQKGRNGLRDNTFLSRNRAADPIPLVILINENTASASEIVAGAMQDHDRALIVGETSFGKGLVQSIIPLDYGGGLTLTSAKYYTPSGRLIQRDYSAGGFYDYYTHGGSNNLDPKAQSVKRAGPEKKTDSGRSVYEGGGIAPDETISDRKITPAQRRLVSPLFAFSRELVNGRIAAVPAYKVTGGINFEGELRPTDFLISEAAFKAFQDFVSNNPTLKPLAPLVQRNRAFVELQMRYNIVTATYGRVIADRVLITTGDQQVAKAIDVLPRAKDLALAATQQQPQP
ncbi:MAG: S41 family peptidase [Acidobacteriota bacterium]|nr:S41 family peptidase [Acidobacteriota bacterium]